LFSKVTLLEKSKVRRVAIMAILFCFIRSEPLFAQELSSKWTNASPMEALGQDIQRVFALGREGLVRVRAESPVGILSGSGFLVDDGGVVVTSSSLFVPGGRIWIESSTKEQWEAQVVGVDRESSVLVVRGHHQGKPLGWGDETFLRAGSLAVLAGFPFNQPAAPSLAVVAGWEGKSPRGSYFCTTHLRAAHPLLPGCVGGVLLDAQARVVGMVTGSMDQPGQTYALPSSSLRRVVEDLRSYGEVRRGWLGVTAEESADGVGVVVESVQEGAPAYLAGLRPRDRLLKIGGGDVRDGADVRRLSFGLRAGDTVRLVVEREGVRSSFDAVAMLRPSPHLAGLSGWAREFNMRTVPSFHRELTEIAMSGDRLP
jgi:S1-C subfamily serine protease